MLTARRRSFATLVRVQQELRKRAERLHPPATGDVTRLLSPRWRAAARRDQLLSNSRAHLPLPWVNATCQAALESEIAPLCKEAERVISGRWRLFDFEITDTPLPAWRRHPRSGKPTPSVHFSRVPYLGDDDVKYVWELNRHHGLLRLAQAYFLSRDERYAERLLLLLDNWIDENPPTIGVNWVAALEVAFRAIVWTWIWQLSAASAHWTSTRFERLLAVQQAAGRYLEHYDSIHHSPNTHLTGEALGLLYLGTCWPQLRDARRWRKRALAILVSEVPHQLLSDGFHFERATGYHRYTLEFYLHAMALTPQTDPGRDVLRRAVAAAAHATRLLQMPDGNWPVIGDEDGGLAVPLSIGDSRNQSQLLILAASLQGDASQRPARRVAGDDVLSKWFGVAPLTGCEPVQRSGSLPAAGYYVVHAGDRRDTYCLVDAGPHGGRETGHAHTDLGHVELVMQGQRIWVDPGCPVYGSAPERRDHYRSLSAHACLMIDRQPLATPRGPFGWHSVAPTPEVELRDEHGVWSCRLRYPVATTAAAVRHERLVSVVAEDLVIVADDVTGVGRHVLEWNWPLGETTGRETPLESDVLRLTDSVSLAWTIGASPGATHESSGSLISCFTSPTYGVERESKRLRVSAEASLPFLMFTVVASGLSAAQWDADRRLLRLTFRDGRPARHLVWNPADRRWATLMSVDEVRT